MQLTGENHIGFSRSAIGNLTFQTFDPVRNCQNEQIFVQASVDEIESSVLLADEAFYDYSQTKKEEKASFLALIAQKLEENKPQLLEVYQRETGLTAYRGEVELGRTMDQLHQFELLLLKDEWNKEVVSSLTNVDGTRLEIKKKMIPLGPVVVFGASNFPFAYSTVGGDTVAALAAGCPVIVKGHPLHAGTSELVAGLVVEAAKETNMPEGVFSHLHASNFEVGKHLVEHSLVKAVGFTGSVEGGRAIMDMAAHRAEPIPVFAEMGSLNPVIFFEDELKKELADWAKKYAHSIANDNGQFCTKPGLLFMPKSFVSKFKDALGKEFEQRNPTPFLSPSIEKRFVDNKLKLTSASLENIPVHHARPSVLTVTTEEFVQNPNFLEEVFGPFSVLISYDQPEELTLLLKRLKGQLTASVIASPTELRQHAAIVELLQFKAGRLVYNGVPTGVQVVEAMQHGGPYPSSSDARFTAVGTQSIYRFVRPVAFQNFPNY